MTEESKAFKIRVRGFQVRDGVRHGYLYRKFMVLAPNKWIAEEEILRILEREKWERVDILKIEEKIHTGPKPE